MEISSLPFKILTICGIWKPIEIKNKIFFEIRRFVYYFIQVSFTVSFSIHVISNILNSGNLNDKKSSEDIYILLSYYLNLINLVSLSYNGEKIYRLQRMIASTADEQNKDEMDSVKKCELFIRFLFT